MDNIFVHIIQVKAVKCRVIKNGKAQAIHHLLPELHHTIIDFNCDEFMRLPPHEIQPTIAVMVKLMDDVECIKSLNVKCN